MRSRTTFLTNCLVGVTLFSLMCILVHVRAADQNSSNCESLLMDYLEKTDAFLNARETLERAHVVRAKAVDQDIPPNYKELEDEYDSNNNDSFQNLIDGLGSQLPAVISSIHDFNNFFNIVELLLAAQTAYDSALAAQNAAEIAFANCQGQQIVTIWCERGNNCKLPPGMQGNSRAHKIYDCPNKVMTRKLIKIKINCDGEWWICDGVNRCPRSLEHVDEDDGTATTPSTPIYYACGTHETTVSGNHESAVCGTSGHYECDNSEHVLFTCPTNPDNQDQTCDYGTYYSCSPHDHSYPSVDNTPNCSSCTDGCSSCLVTCAVGHTYDPSVAYDVNQHRTRTCSLDTCVQTWQNCVSSTPICDDPSRNSQNQNCLEEE